MVANQGSTLPRCRQCGADSNGAELCPRCDLRQAEAGKGEPRSRLACALVAAQQAAQAVEKSSANNFHKYRYASAEAIISEARAALSSAGLALLVVRSWVDAGSLTTTFWLQHISGERFELVYNCPVIEDKGRPLDKAVATARTYTLGYALRDLLLLPRVEEGTDTDQRDDRHHEPARPPAVTNSTAIVAAANIEKAIGLAQTMRDLNSVVAPLVENKLGIGETAIDYLRQKFAQRKEELLGKPAPAKTAAS